MGQGGTSSMHPHSPRGDTALPPPRGEHRVPPALVPGKLHGEWELNCRLLCPAHRDTGEEPGPSPSPTRLIAMVRAAERPGGTRDFAGSEEETRTCLKPRIHHRRVGSCLWEGGRRELPSLASQASGASSARLAPAGRRAVLVSESKHCPFQGLLPSPEPGAEAEQIHYSSSSRD